MITDMLVRDIYGGSDGIDELLVEDPLVKTGNTLSIKNATDTQRGVTTLQIDVADITSINKATTPKYVSDLISARLISGKSFRGNYDASTNLFPSTGGSGTAGAIQAGDYWVVSVAGTLGGQAVNIGDTVLALDDAPGQDALKWFIDVEDQAVRNYYPTSIYSVNQLVVYNGVIYKCLINNTTGITPDNTSANWVQDTEFSYTEFHTLATNGYDGKGAYMPSQTLLGAKTAFPSPYTYLLYPGVYQTDVALGNLNNFNLVGIDRSKALVVCAAYPINISGGNGIAGFENLTVVRYASPSAPACFNFGTGNIGVVNIRGVIFQANGSNSQADLYVNGVTAGTINIYNCFFNSNLSLIVDNATTACNINFIACQGTLKIRCQGKAHIYAENSTVEVLSGDHTDGIIDFDNCAVAEGGIQSTAVASADTGVLLNLCNFYDPVSGYASLATNGCYTVLTKPIADFNICNFVDDSGLLVIPEDTNRSREFTPTVADEVFLQIYDHSLIFNLTSAPMILNIPDTSSSVPGSMAIRTFYVTKQDTSENALTITASGSDVLEGNPILAYQGTIILQVDFTNHKINIK